MNNNLNETLNHDQFADFEKNILNPDNTGGIKYSIDRDLEASVKWQYLKENFPNRNINEILNRSGKSVLDLSEPAFYSEVLKKLNENA